MTDWQEALERLQIFTDPNAAVTDATVIRAHIEGLEASIRSLSPLNYEERCRLRDAEARVRELEADGKRLDYIERTFSGMTNRERYLPVQMIWGKGANGRTLREACDKYMKRDAALDAAREG